VVVAGAADCMLLVPVYMFLDRFRLLVAPGVDGSVACRPFDRGRSGLVPGEGAGFVVLEAEPSAYRRRARVYGEVLGYGAAVEPPTLLEGSSSSGFCAAMETAVADAGCDASDVAQVSAYGAGTLGTDREEARAIAATFGARVPVTSTKGALGYLGAASGAVDAVLALRGIEEGIVPPTARHVEADPACPIHCVARRERPLDGTVTICNSHGLGGQYASLVLGGPS
jgi:3-oxoacyl-(acyl-carrier-protein) synthase